MSLEDAIAKAKAELEQLKAREEGQLESSGIKGLVTQLTNENQALNAKRVELRGRLDELAKAVESAREHGAMLELQIKGARARVQKLNAALERR